MRESNRILRDFLQDNFPGTNLPGLVLQVAASKVRNAAVLERRAIPYSLEMRTSAAETVLLEMLVKSHKDGDEANYARNLRALAKIQEFKLHLKLYT